MGVLMRGDAGAGAGPRAGLRACCCGCSLQAGCIVIGVLGLINGICSLYVALYGVWAQNETHPSLYEHDHNLIINVIMVLSGALHVATGLSLIYGADKRRPSLLKFWLFTRYIEFVITVAASLYFLIAMLIKGVAVSSVLVTAFSFTIGLGILAYCIAIVHSFCREVTNFNVMKPLQDDIKIPL